ncbi:hypothetical protein [Corallococcus caeni]
MDGDTTLMGKVMSLVVNMDTAARSGAPSTTASAQPGAPCAPAL